jgi:hypothetical protein
MEQIQGPFDSSYDAIREIDLVDREMSSAHRAALCIWCVLRPFASRRRPGLESAQLSARPRGRT